MASGGGAEGPEAAAPLRLSDFTQFELLLLLLSEDKMLKELSEESSRLLSFTPR